MSLISRAKMVVFALGSGVAALVALRFWRRPGKHVVASAVWGS